MDKQIYYSHSETHDNGLPFEASTKYNITEAMRATTTIHKNKYVTSGNKGLYTWFVQE